MTTEVTGVVIMVDGAVGLGPERGVAAGVGEGVAVVTVAGVAAAPPAVGPVGVGVCTPWVRGDLLRSGCVWRKRV